MKTSLYNEGYDIFCRIHSILESNKGSPDIKKWLNLPDNVSDYYVWEAGKPSWGIPLLDKIGSKFATRRACFNSIILYSPEVIRDFLFISNGDGVLTISFNNITNDWLALKDFEQFCPKIGSGYTWAKVFVSERVSAVLKEVLSDCGNHSIYYLRMVNNLPVLSSFNSGMNGYINFPYSIDSSGKIFSKYNTEMVTEAIISSYPVEIKEVYILDNTSKSFSHAIARKNSDGEYTLTIY